MKKTTENGSDTKICYLCGKNLATTRDHIFPRSLFPTPRPDDLLTAPACLECNNLLPNDEEVFRVLATSGDGLLNPTGRRIWEDRVRPTLVKNRRGFKSLLQKSLGQLDLYLSDGRYVGSHPGIQFEGPRIANVINKIAKGLYYVDTQCHLPINVEIKFDITQFDPGRYIEGELKEAISGARRIRIGDGEAVTYWRNCVADDPRQSMTWICFYRSNVLFILTYTPEYMKQHTG